ncbi:hypothetical protein [Cellulomonas sp. Y8]|uniref:hypothetical protein n=1 Tax=Cellulomonas sp. Y8 TaxID=2591145 RepID=UPI0011CA584B|nr:hypothetical protein [Cellulomonas sp. Y8]
MTTTDDRDWGRVADLAQDSLDHFFGAPWPQHLHNSHPAGHRPAGDLQLLVARPRRRRAGGRLGAHR